MQLVKETFCTYYKTCSKGTSCPAAYTDIAKETIKKNKVLVKIWGAKPDCYEKEENHE